MSTPTGQTITWGPYFGFTEAELLIELDRYKTARKQSFSRLSGSSTNAQTYSFGQRVDGSLDDWQSDIQAALYWIDPGLYPMPPPTNLGAATFV
jgi:hypothetical protein